MTTLISSSKELDITQSQASHAIKFGFLCTNIRNIPKWFGISCLFVFHLQTLAMILKNASVCLDQGKFINFSIVEIFIKVMIPSEFLSYENTVSVYICLFLMFFYILILLGFAIYLHIKLFLATPIPTFIQDLWSFLCYVHCLLFFFPIQSFIVRVLKEIFADNLLTDINVLAIVILYFNMTVNWVLVIASAKFFHIIIKTKDPLSSKNNIIKSLDLLSKAIAGTLWAFATEEEWLQIFILVISFVEALIKDWSFFYVLPYYHIQTLQVSAILQAPSTVLALLNLTVKILSKAGFEFSDSFLLVSWALMAPIVMLGYHNILWKTFERIIYSNPNTINPYHVAHKRYILRYLMKNRINPHRDINKVNWFYYLYRTKVSFIIKKINISHQDFDDDKKYLQEVVKELMISKIRKNPKDHFTRANLAYFYVKYEKAYLLANNIIEELLKHAPSFALRVSLSLIRIELQKELFLQYSHQEERSEGQQGLNLLKYVQLHTLNEEVKKQINKQIKLHLNFWNSFLSNEPNMGELADISGKIYRQKNLVGYAWNKFSKIRDKRFSSPLLMYGLYLSFINNNPIDGEKIIENYYREVEIYGILTQRDELTDDTLFGDETVQITMSGLKSKLGRILSCSSNIKQSLGWDRAYLLQRPINLIMTSYFRDKHDGFLIRHYHTGRIMILNQTRTIPVLKSDGFVKPIWLHVKINPMVETGLSYVATIRPLKYKKMTVLLRKDGTIDGMCQEFAQELNLLSQYKNGALRIFSVCPDFQFVNETFNIIAYRSLLENSYASKASETLNFEEINSPERRTIRKKSSDIIGGLEQNITKSLATVTKIRLRSTLIEAYSYFESPSYKVLGIENQVKNIYEKFTEGSKLIFYPLKSNYLEDNNNRDLKEVENKGRPIICHVQISYRIDDKDFIKILTIEKISDEDIENTQDIFEINKIRDVPSPNSIKERENDIKTYKNDSLTPHNLVASNNLKLSNTVLLGSSAIPAGKLKPEKWAREDFNSYNDEANISILDELKNTEPLKVSKRSSSHRKDSMKNLQITNPETKRQQDLSFIGFPEESSARVPLKVSALTQSHDLPAGSSLQIRNLSSKKDTLGNLKNRTASLMEGVDSLENKNRTSVETQDLNIEKNHYLMEKLKKFKDKYNERVVDLMKVENSIGSSYLSKGKKVQSLVVKALKLENKNTFASIFRYAFIKFILFSLGLQVVQMINIDQVISDIEIKLSVLEKGFYRIDSILQMNINLRLWNGILEGFYDLGDWEASNLVLRETIKFSASYLNSFNSDLRNQVSKIDEKFQILFDKKDVRMFEKEDDGSLKLMTTDSNFVAIQIIINKLLRFCNQDLPSEPSSSIDKRDLEFVLNNSLNDLLISSENSVGILVDDFSHTFTAVRNKLTLTYGLFLFGTLTFLLICIKYLCFMRAKAKSFMIIFFRLDPQTAQELKSHLQHFMNSLDSNMFDLEFSEESEEPKNGSNNQAKTQKIFRQASMSRYYIRQMSLYARICPFLIVFVVWSTVYFILALNIISDISANQVQIQSSLNTINQQDLLVVELIELLMTNSTTKIRNTPIEQDFTANLYSVQQIQHLIDKFKGNGQSLTKSQEEIFFSFPCNYFTNVGSAEFEHICLKVSKGAENTGLAMLNSDLFITAGQIYDRYIISSKSEKELAMLFDQTINVLRDLVNIARIMLGLLHNATSESVKNKATKLDKEAVIFTILTLIIASIWAVILWARVIKRIIKYEIKDREILQLVPIKHILANRYLRQHLYKNSNGMLDNINSIF